MLDDDPITATAMQGLTTLRTDMNLASDLAGLEYATNLESLILFNNINPVTELRPIAGLTALTTLVLSNCQISDITPLSGLTKLTTLNLYFNKKISDVSPLSGLTHLTELNLGHNIISDLSGLSGLTHLTELRLGQNKISDVSSLSGLTNLTALRLNANKITDVSPLSGLVNLTALKLGSNPLLLDTSPLYSLTQGNLTDVDVDILAYAPWDINEDENVDASDVALVTAALGQSGADILNARTDVNGDGVVDADDLTLVTANLDADDEASPSAMTDIASLLDPAVLESLDPAVLAAQLSMLHSKSDGSLKYERAIALLESVLAALRPEQTLLLANYPNPFNPETWVPLSLSGCQHCRNYYLRCAGQRRASLSVGSSA